MDKQIMRMCLVISSIEILITGGVVESKSNFRESKVSQLANGIVQRPEDGACRQHYDVLESNVHVIMKDTRELKTQLRNLKYNNNLLYELLKKLSSSRDSDVNSVYADEPKSQCPRHFVRNRNTMSCYRFVSRRVTWDTARKDCKSMGADLVSIQSAREQHYLNSHSRQSAENRHCSFWTGGLQDEKKAGVWYWAADGKAMSYSNWNYNEPNNGVGNEHCVQMLWAFNWAWNDSNCDMKACYICERSM